MSKDTGGPAFPFSYDDKPKGVKHIYSGMTLRDYFAAKAIQGLFASGNLQATDTDEALARDAYIVADAMLKAREV
jgi:hypothetical protein